MSATDEEMQKVFRAMKELPDSFAIIQKLDLLLLLYQAHDADEEDIESMVHQATKESRDLSGRIEFPDGTFRCRWEWDESLKELKG